MAKQSTAQTKTVERVMREFKEGDLKSAGHTVRSRQQAVAIGLSEAGVRAKAGDKAEGEGVPVMSTIRSCGIVGLTLTGLAVGCPAWAQTAPPDSSGPQTAIPAPLPRGQADVPGGSARNGVITPPPTGGTMPVVTPPAHGRTPVIKPPTGIRSARPIQPK